MERMVHNTIVIDKHRCRIKPASQERRRKKRRGVRYDGRICYQRTMHRGSRVRLQLDEIAQAQILELCCQEFARDAHIRIMPDAHAGAGCVIGTTMAVSDRIAPSLVGVDIGCGMEAVKLSDMEADLPRLDEVVRTRVPSGFAVRARPHPFMKDVKNGFLKDLRCAGLVGLDRAQLDVGTLGGGNHFIELDRADGGGLWLVVHSGSRHTGLVVSEIYRRLAKAYCAGVPEGTLLDLFLSYASGSAKRDNLAKLTEALTAAERTAERRHGRSVPADLSYLEGQLMSFYLQDMELMTRYADLNRRAIATEIVEGMGLTDSVFDRFCTVHNFISRSDGVLRKGAVPAPAGERFLLPMNMRDGGLICIGKGNPEWNSSGPHGAGRIMSRGDAKRTLSLSDYTAAMEGIYTTCVSPETLDEAPDAYKPMDSILAAIGPTAEVADRLRPVYNFKAGGK